MHEKSKCLHVLDSLTFLKCFIYNLHWIPEIKHDNILYLCLLNPLDNVDVYFDFQAIVLEGSYWKRRIEVVIKEYHKWRIYYKKRVRAWQSDLWKKILHGIMYLCNHDLSMLMAGFHVYMCIFMCIMYVCESKNSKRRYSLFLIQKHKDHVPILQTVRHKAAVMEFGSVL